MASEIDVSIVVPVFQNEAFIDDLIDRLVELNTAFQQRFEAIIVVDGSPDRSTERLRDRLPTVPFAARLVLLSRNFGSFSAIRAGLAGARGRYLAVMAADLQEPAELFIEMVAALRAGNDIAVGVRSSRSDPALSRMFSATFWKLYRRFVMPDIPASGVDVFACSREFSKHLLELRENRSSLVGLVYWLGFRRVEIPYVRLPRRYGKGAWSLRRRLAYLLDSMFAFSDLPIRILMAAGLGGVTLSLTMGLAVFILRLAGEIPIPGYAATVLVVMFFGGLNSIGLSLVGEYAWRSFENTKRRPEYVVAQSFSYDADKIGTKNPPESV